MQRWLVLGGLVSLSAIAADLEGSANPSSERGQIRVQASGDVLGELAGKGLGGELRGSLGLGRFVDAGAGVSIGSSLGILVTARLHTPWTDRSRFRPFAQVRTSLHPGSGGYGGGLFTGVLIEAGPGRVELGAAGHLYPAVTAYLPYALFAMAGYEFDLHGRQDQATPTAEPTDPTEAVRVIVGATLIRGRVHDLEDHPLKRARVVLSGAGLRAPATSIGAEFSFPVEEGDYTITAEADGYYLRGVRVSVKRGEQLVYSLPLRPATQSGVVELTRRRVEIKQSIQFEFNAARILPESYFILDAVADTLIRNEQLRQIRVEGHTDNLGGTEFNQNLSEERASAVVKYLIDAGVDPVRLQAQGFGLAKPVDSNKTEAGRAANRRVQFEIVE